LPVGGANGRAMSVPEDDDWLVEGAVDGVQLWVGRFGGGCSPTTARAGVDEGEGLFNFDSGELAQPG
jgi:hypothetical protein